MDYKIFLKTEFADLDLSEAPQQSPEVLLGVSQAAAAQLALLQAGTVFDLANASLFINAARIVDGAADPQSVFGRQLAVPNEIIADGAAGTALADLPNASISSLRGVAALDSAALETALGVKSIRDLAFWPPFVAAQALVAHAYEPFAASDYDQQSPEELIPRTGQHATQKVIYRKTLLIESKPIARTAWDGKTIDLSLLDETGFGDVAFGAILSIHQTWTPRRVALGTLLHSLPLGPGESTRMAVVDWVRRLQAASTEDINQSEELSNSLAQSTAIAEITKAVATQVQDGRSGGFSSAGSTSAGGTAFFGIGLGSASESLNAGIASTYSVSNTTRSESASALQNIASQTHQSTSLARNKRAAVISEVSQQESENLTTRILTNYNHMHALSVQYYEVVQIYETELAVAGIERCIFIPMRKVNFRSESIVRRYLAVLIRYALDKRTRDLLLQYRNTLVLEYSIDRFAGADLNQLSALVQSFAAQPAAAKDARGPQGLPAPSEKQVQLRLLLSQIEALRRGLGYNSEAGYRRGVIEDFDRNAFRKFTIDRGALLNDVFWEEDSGIAAVNIQLAGGGQIRVSTPAHGAAAARSLNPAWASAIPVNDIRGLAVEIVEKQDSNPSDFKLFRLNLQLELSNTIFWLDASFVHSEGFSGTISLFDIHPPVDFDELAGLLMEHQLYYSQQVWMRGGSQSLIMQLAPYTITLGGHDGIHIVDYIDPQPITVAGNYVAFRFTYDADKPWSDWLARQRKVERPRYDLLPIPTGGVFAEAVLGEFNSAEKLDLTRFWKWQDNPIPLAAPDIAPLDASSTPARVDAPAPGQLQTSDLVKVQPLQELPAGLATSRDVLNALMAENIFKNLGGVEVTAKLLQAAQTAATNGDKSTQELLSNTAKGIMSAFEGLATSFLKSPDGVQNITQLGGILNKLGASGSGGGGLSSLTSLLGGAGGAGAADAGAAGAADTAAGIVGTIGPLLEEIAPLVLLA